MRSRTYANLPPPPGHQPRPGRGRNPPRGCPVVVFTHADPQSIPLVFPWRIVALLTVAVPLVAAFVTTAASAVALRRRPVRISTMAFD